MNPRLAVYETATLPLSYPGENYFKISLERRKGIGPSTFSLGRRHSTTELPPPDKDLKPILAKTVVII